MRDSRFCCNSQKKQGVEGGGAAPLVGGAEGGSATPADLLLAQLLLKARHITELVEVVVVVVVAE